MAEGLPEYILGTSEAELVRLGYQHQVWGNEAARLWDLAGYGLGHDLLDIGCGPGYATLDLAHLVGPGGAVHGLDASAKYLEVLARRAEAAGVTNVTTHNGDVHRLPLNDACVDGVFARWLLCFVRSPRDVVAEAFRVLRPGGALVILDYFNYLAVGMFPRRDSFTRLFQAYHKNVTHNGGSYDVGNTLPGVLDAAGFEVETLDPICRIARPLSREWNWLKLFTEGHVPQLVEKGLMSAMEQEQLKQDWEELAENPGAFFFTPPMMGIVARKQPVS